MEITPPSPPLRLKVAPTPALLDDEALPQAKAQGLPLDPFMMTSSALFGGILCVCYLSRVQLRSLSLTTEERAKARERLHLTLAAYAVSLAGVLGLFQVLDSPAEWSLAFVPAFVAALGQHGINGALELGRRRSLALHGPLWELEGAPKAPSFRWMFILLGTLESVLLGWLGVS